MTYGNYFPITPTGISNNLQKAKEWLPAPLEPFDREKFLPRQLKDATTRSYYERAQRALCGGVTREADLVAASDHAWHSVALTLKERVNSTSNSHDDLRKQAWDLLQDDQISWGDFVNSERY
jgi:hypothetical protein